MKTLLRPAFRVPRSAFAALFVLFALFCSPRAHAATEVVAYVTATNTPAGLTTNIVVNIGTATTRNWTNSASGAPSTSIQITNSIAASVTNLVTHFAAYPIYSVGSGSPQAVVDYTSTNTAVFTITAPLNTNLTVTFGGNWARVVYVTNTYTDSSPILWPTNAMSARARTNAGNAIVNLLADSSVKSNSVPPGRAWLQHYTDNTSSQTLSNKTLTSPILTGGRFNNITNGTGTNVALTNVNLHIAAITGADLSGIISAITNGTAYNLNLINATNRGIVAALTNGIYTNATLIGSKATNFVNYGTFSSRYSASAGEAYGNGAVASGINSLAVGPSAEASATETVAIGNGAQATNSSATAVGDGAVAGGGAGGGNASAFGYTATATGNASGNFGASGNVAGDYSYAFGYDNTVTHSNTTVIGNQITSSGDNLVQIGSGSQSITLAGPVVGSTVTNTTFRGTNVFNGRIDLTSGARTSLANGYNSGTVLGTNVYIRLSGASGAATNAGFAAGVDGTLYIVQVDNPGLSYTLLHDSGLEATAANRIYTGTGALVNSTNNPVMMQLLYDGTASRYRLLTFR